MLKTTITAHDAETLNKRIDELVKRGWTMKHRTVISTEYPHSRGVRHIAKMEKGTKYVANYRKKPIVIQAVQWKGKESSWIELLAMTDGACSKWSIGHGYLLIPTLEGNMTADVDDYIIKGIKGEFYPCKPDIFEASYDLVEGESK